jgi:hypothetical protein
MSGTGDCEDEVIRAGGEGFSRRRARAAMEALDDRAQQLVREKGISWAEAAIQAARELGDADQFATAIQRRQRLQNLQKAIMRRNSLRAAAADLGNKRRGGVADLATALRNQIVAIVTPTKGGRYSAEARIVTRRGQYVGLVRDLANAGLLQTARSGALADKWGRELYELSMQAAGRKGKPGVTGDRVALQIATIIHGWQEVAKTRVNRAGGYIGDYAGYITRTVHDADKMRHAGDKRGALQRGLDPIGLDAARANWVKRVLPLLDEDRMGEVGAAELGEVFNSFVAGHHMVDDQAMLMGDLPGRPRGANVAKRASASRVLHFKDGESWLAYQKEFGTGSLLEQTLGSLDRAARQEVLLDTWGTNPRDAFAADQRWLAEQYVQSSPESVDRLKQAEAKLQARFDMLDGTANRPAHRLTAEIANGVRTVESMAKLGLVAATHLTVGVTKASELRYQGVGVLERHGNYLQALLNIFRPRGNEAMREVSDLLLAGLEGAQGSMLSKFQPDDGVPGRLSKIANTFFKVSGLTNLVDAQKAATMHLLSHHLGRMIDREYEALPAETQRAFEAYTISKDDWNALRSAPNHPTAEGRVYLTPDAAERATPEAMVRVARDLTPSVDQDAIARDKLSLKLHAYYSDVAARTVVSPGIDDRALILGGLRPGTAAGEAARFFAQFKTWPLAAFKQVWGRELYGGQGIAGAVSGVAQVIAGSAVLGYLVMTIKDSFRGLNPRPPNDSRTWMAAMAQGGGFGVLGDFLFGEYSRFGGSVSDTILGPVVGQATTEVFNLWNDLKLAAYGSRSEAKQAEHDLAPELARIVTGNLPFVNMHAARVAWNYLFLYSLQEWLNPGYLARHERLLQQKTGQTYWLSPAQNHLHTFGH